MTNFRLNGLREIPNMASMRRAVTRLEGIHMSTTSLTNPTSFAPAHAVHGVAAWFGRLRQVLQLGHRVQTARRLRAQRIADAAAVRRYADAMRAADPRLAADLWAAADRYDSSL